MRLPRRLATALIAALALLPSVQHIVIPRSAAEQFFIDHLEPTWIQKTQEEFPGAVTLQLLAPDAFGRLRRLAEGDVVEVAMRDDQGGQTETQQPGTGGGGHRSLTAERFVPDPFTSQPGGRLYHTGDLVRRRLEQWLGLKAKEGEQ